MDANSVIKVLDIVEGASQDFNPVNISTAFHRLARMWRDVPDLNGSSNGQTRLDVALNTLMQLAVRNIKQVGILWHAMHHSCVSCQQAANPNHLSLGGRQGRGCALVFHAQLYLHHLMGRCISRCQHVFQFTTQSLQSHFSLAEQATLSRHLQQAALLVVVSNLPFRPFCI